MPDIYYALNAPLFTHQTIIGYVLSFVYTMITKVLLSLCNLLRSYIYLRNNVKWQYNVVLIALFSFNTFISTFSTRKTSIRSTDSTQPFTLDLDRLIQTEQTETGSVSGILI